MGGILARRIIFPGGYFGAGKISSVYFCRFCSSIWERQLRFIGIIGRSANIGNTAENPLPGCAFCLKWTF